MCASQSFHAMYSGTSLPPPQSKMPAEFQRAFLVLLAGHSRFIHEPAESSSPLLMLMVRT